MCTDRSTAERSWWYVGRLIQLDECEPLNSLSCSLCISLKTSSSHNSLNSSARVRIFIGSSHEFRELCHMTAHKHISTIPDLWESIKFLLIWLPPCVKYIVTVQKVSTYHHLPHIFVVVNSGQPSRYTHICTIRRLAPRIQRIMSHDRPQKHKYYTRYLRIDLIPLDTGMCIFKVHNNGAESVGKSSHLFRKLCHMSDDMPRFSALLLYIWRTEASISRGIRSILKDLVEYLCFCGRSCDTIFWMSVMICQDFLQLCYVLWRCTCPYQ